jgi:hypothetical protein
MLGAVLYGPRDATNKPRQSVLNTFARNRLGTCVDLAWMTFHMGARSAPIASPH